jgi:hypothetical protein
VTGLPPGEFTDLLPLLRRTFGTFAAGERRAVAEHVRHGTGRAAATGGGEPDLDEARAAAALPVVATLLGLAGVPLADPAGSRQ